MKTKALIISIIMAVIGYSLWAILSDYDSVLRATKLVGASGIALALFLSLINYGLRYLRWDMMIGKVSNIKIPHFTRLLYYFSGFALTTTPGKAGEAIRSLYLKQHDVSYTRSLAALFVERLFDLLSMLIIAAIALVYFKDFQWLGYLLLTLTMLVIAFIKSTLMRSWLKHFLSRVIPASKHHFLDHVFDVLDHSKALLKTGFFCTALFIGIIAWGAEAAALSLIVHLIGNDSPYLVVAGIYAIAMLAGAVSFLPGGLGGAEAAMGVMLALIGLTAGEAASATIICRVTTLWFAVLLGALAMLYLTYKPRKNSKIVKTASTSTDSALTDLALTEQSSLSPSTEKGAR